MKRLLPIIAATLTNHPRQLVQAGIDFTWSKSWVYNLFRVYELIFWRKEGPRLEMSVRPDGEGGTIMAFHSWEAAAVQGEVFIRTLFTFKFPAIKIWIPILSTPQGIPIFASPYLFAISFDTSALSTEAQNTGQPWNHTVTGSNPILIAMDVAETSTTDPYVSMTYNSVAMTVANSKASSNRFIKAWYMNNPPTGSSFQIAPVLTLQFNQGASSSFSGVIQSGIDNSATAAAGSTTQSVTITPTASGGTCWGIIGTISDGGGVYTVIAGTTQRQAGSAPMHYADSNGVIPSGSGTQLGWTTSSSSNWAAIAITIAPFGAVATVLPFKTLLGVGI